MRYGSAKISLENIEKMLKDNHLTGNEISILLWLALYQDEYGRTFNVKYKDVCKDMEISIQGFYDCIYGLERKSYIRHISRSYTDGWNIEIYNNVFATKEDDKKRYLNINRNIFFSKKFLDLKANEKKLLMKIVLEYRPERDYYINILKLGELIGICNTQLLRSYIEKLKSFFKIGYKQKHNKDKKIIIFQRNNREIERQSQDKSIFYHYMKGKLKALLRKFKVQYTDDQMTDLIILMNQYKEHYTILYQTIIDTIAQKRNIEPKLINHIVSAKLSLYP